jgi:hypothetical protein
MVISFKVIKEVWKKLFDKPSPQINCAHHYEGDPAYAEHEQLVFLKCIKCGKTKNMLT